MGFTGRTFILFLGIGLFFHDVGTTEIDEDTKEKINTAVETAEVFLDVVTSDQFSKVLKTAGSFASNLGPYGAAVSAVVSLVLVFIPTEDPDEAFRNEVREQFKVVNDKLDSIIEDVNSLEAVIQWTVKKDRFDTYATKIYIASADLVRLADSSSPDAAKKDILDRYKNNYEDSGQVLLAVILGRATETSIIDLFVEYTKYERELVLNFMRQCLSFLVEAMQVEVAMLTIDNTDQGYIDDRVSFWRQAFSEVQEKFKNVTEGAFFVEKAKEIDIPKFIREKQLELSPHYFPGALYDLLKKKYYWYQWLVVSIKVVDDSEELAVGGSQYWTFDFRQKDKEGEVIDRKLYVVYQGSTDSDWARETELQGELNDYKNRGKDSDKCGDTPTTELVFSELPTDVAFKMVVIACHDFVSRGDGASATHIIRCPDGDCSDYHVAAFGTGKTEVSDVAHRSKFATLLYLTLFILAKILL